MESLKRFPFILIFFVYLLYLGYQMWEFNFSAEGAVEQHKTVMVNSQKELGDLKGKLAEGQKFLKSLEAKKAELQAQIKKLSEYQGMLSEGLDVASLMKLLITEAKKLELRVERLEPGKRNQKEYYLEQEFKLDVRGTYQEIVLFTQRVAQVQRILRVENYSLKPYVHSGKSTKMLSASLSVRAYQYTVGKEDRISVGGQTR